MADEIKNQAQAAVDAPAKVAATIATTTKKVADETVKTAKRARAATARRTKRTAKPATARKTTRRAKTARRTATTATRTNTRTAARKTAAAAQEGFNTMNFTANKLFAGFDMPAIAPFQSLFTNSGERSQDAVVRTQKVAGELTDLTRANVEAIVEAGRVAAEGVRSIGQDAIARSRAGVEQTANAIRSLTEAKSPTEFVQLQSELARTSFDRMVAETSRMTESMVKLAGEAFQPLSNRAAANTERFNTLVA